MQEPWNLKEDDSRLADSLTNFIIFCEDGEIEPEYFNIFSTKNIKISPIRNCGQQHRQIDYATDYCRTNDLLELINGKERLKLDEGTQVWCVFDRDKEENDKKDTSFTDSIEIAQLKGMRTAWSNDDFELWILLHFEDVNPEDPQHLSRKFYYERLTKIFQGLEPRNDLESKLFNLQNFDYYRMMKQKKKFITITLQHMKGKTDIALERAKTLETYHSNPAKPFHKMVPCTMVHLLVQELIANS